MTEQIAQLPFNDPEIKKWELTTENILNGTFGMPNSEKHNNTSTSFDKCFTLSAVRVI